MSDIRAPRYNSTRRGGTRKKQSRDGLSFGSSGFSSSASSVAVCCGFGLCHWCLLRQGGFGYVVTLQVGRIRLEKGKTTVRCKRRQRRRVPARKSTKLKGGTEEELTQARLISAITGGHEKGRWQQSKPFEQDGCDAKNTGR